MDSEQQTGTDTTALATEATGTDATGTDRSDALSPGKRVGEYRIERELGRGGMGVVYEGVQPVIGKRVAIKVLPDSLSGDPTLVRRFVEEARVVNHIAHRNIVDVFAFGALADGRQYFVMEYLRGRTLADRLREAPVGTRELCERLAEVADALAAAHAMGVVHRDIKPENLWLAEPQHGEPYMKVLDFGIAKLLHLSDSDGGLTESGAVIGSVRYMAPEQCAGEPVDGRTDIYALGMVAYLGCSGRLPFAGTSAAEVVAQQLFAAPAPPSGNGELPETLEALILSCLAKDPADRPQRADEVAARLRAIAAAVDSADVPKDGAAGARRGSATPVPHRPAPDPPRRPSGSASESVPPPVVSSRKGSQSGAPDASVVRLRRRGRIAMVLGAAFVAAAGLATTGVLHLWQKRPATPPQTPARALTAVVVVAPVPANGLAAHTAQPDTAAPTTGAPAAATTADAQGPQPPDPASTDTPPKPAGEGTQAREGQVLRGSRPPAPAARRAAARMPKAGPARPTPSLLDAHGLIQENPL